MKKAIAYFFTFLIILLISSMFLISCKAKVLPPDTSTQIIIQKDSSSKVQITDRSKAIIDSLSISIGKLKTAKPECDSVSQIAIENFFKTLSFTKNSGDNGYKLKYNQILKRLDLIIKVGATENKIDNNYHTKTLVKYRYIKKTVTLKQKPSKFQFYLIAIGVASILFLIIKLLLLIKSKLLPAVY